MVGLNFDQYPCIHCPAHFSTNHERAEHSSATHWFVEPWLCQECPSGFWTDGALSEHTAKTHPAGRRSSTRCSHETCEGAPPLASREVERRHRKQDHIKQLYRVPRSCVKTGCKYENENYVGMSLHVLHIHAPTCPGCRRKFADGLELLYHKQGVAKDGACLDNWNEWEDYVKQYQYTAVHDDQVEESEKELLLASGDSGQESLMSPAQTPPDTSHKLLRSPLAADAAQCVVYSDISHGPVSLSWNPLHRQQQQQRDGRSVTAFSSYPTPQSPQQYDQAVASPSSNQDATVQQNVAVTRALPATKWEQLVPTLSQAQQQCLEGLGFGPSDFDPNTVHDKRTPNKNSHKELPKCLPDSYSFNVNPKYIHYGNLLWLAVRYSNRDIFLKINEGRPEDMQLKCDQVISSRIEGACEWAVEPWKWYAGPWKVKEWLNEEKKKNGIRVGKPKKRPRDEMVYESPIPRPAFYGSPVVGGTPPDDSIQTRLNVDQRVVEQNDSRRPDSPMTARDLQEVGSLPNHRNAVAPPVRRRERREDPHGLRGAFYYKYIDKGRQNPQLAQPHTRAPSQHGLLPAQLDAEDSENNLEDTLLALLNEEPSDTIPSVL